LFLLTLSGLALNACLPLSEPLPPSTELPPPTGTPTPTASPVWFPPTATPTPLPTLEFTPTPDLQPQVGDILFSDDFSEGDLWLLGRTNTGSAALGKNELTIAISSPRVYVFSVREQPVLTDFYLEITASPSLCRGNDEYGLLLRMTSAEDFYRFSLSCDGQVRLDRLVNGRASSPQPWAMSGAVPSGAPSSSRLAVWAVGREMRFFINGEYQFTASDPMLPSGKIGVFARSGGDKAVTINFSDLIVYTTD
jgi:hypothetical protein